MTEQRLKERAKVLFNSEYVSTEVNERNQKEWVQAVQTLGKKWLYAEQVQRKGTK
jgi:hypothetical protein